MCNYSPLPRLEVGLSLFPMLMVTLDNKSRTQVTLPVNFTFREVQQAANILIQRGSVEYTVEGDFTLATPFGSITRPYRSKGRYDTIRR